MSEDSACQTQEDTTSTARFHNIVVYDFLSTNLRVDTFISLQSALLADQKHKVHQ